MRKTNLIKGFLIIVLSIMLVGTTSVFAADPLDIDFSDDEPSSSQDKNNTNNTNNTNTKNTNSNSNRNTNNTNKNSNNTNSNNTNRNSSSYNNTNTNLPKTGVEDSIPTMVLIVVFGISAVYAYKKINDYKKI